MLKVPWYVTTAGVEQAPISHNWKDDDANTFYSERDSIQASLARTTPAGAVAVALGCLEWVAWRMSEHAEVTLVLQAIEAMWAGLIDRRYVRDLYDSPLALLGRDWQGPERGPVYVAYWQLVPLRSCVQSAEPASPEASCAVRLGRFVMPVGPSRKAFVDWWPTVLERLVQTHPADQDGRSGFGKPIPRVVLDPALDYAVAAEEQYLSDFLATLDPAANPFLASPEEMAESGFVGDPYPG
jgi:hypothetical protein